MSGALEAHLDVPVDGPPADRLSIEIGTGRLMLACENGADIAELCAVAARANPKRGFLIVSKILGRHVPTAPARMRQAMDALAAMLPADPAEPVTFLGMAETATALGQGVFAAYRRAHPGVRALYLQTSRQRVAGSLVLASFEEGHSHATTHLVQVADAAMAALAAETRTLVIVDDECSTGGTFLAGAAAMRAAMPHVERIETCCFTDWSGKSYYPAMPAPTTGHALVHGSMSWEPGASFAAPALASGSNRPGDAPAHGMRSRTGLRDPEAAQRDPIAVRPGERVLVLGDGEHSYEALRVAEEVDRGGGVAAVQCITRSPALLGHAMQSVSRFSDAYGSGAPCFLYNILSHAPDRILIVSEVAGDQQVEAQAALALLGSSVPVEQVHCRYARDARA